MVSVPVRTFYEHNREELELEILAGAAGLDRAIRIPRIQKPGLALAGHLRQVQPERVQILGQTEMDYLVTLEPDVIEARLHGLCASGAACFILSKGLKAPEPLLRHAQREQVPVLGSPIVSSVLIRQITAYLDEVLAPETTVHGSLVDVYGVGVLLVGKSGIGKSECALGLVQDGHRLVGDDVVVIRRRAQGALFGSGAERIRHHMEIRGLGIINIKDLFGVSAIRDSKKIELVVELVEWPQDNDVERLGADELTSVILDIGLPCLKIPVRPARDLTMIVEVAARNHLLKRMGYNAAKILAGDVGTLPGAARAPGPSKPDVGSVE